MTRASHVFDDKKQTIFGHSLLKYWFCVKKETFDHNHEKIQMVMPCRDFLMIVDFSNANANKAFSIILYDKKAFIAIYHFLK